MNYIKYLGGNNIYFSPFDKIESNYLKWINDLSVTKYLDSSIFPIDSNKLQEFVDSCDKNKDVIFLKIIENKSNNYIGNVKLGPINWVHRRAEMGRFIGDKKVHGKGYGTEVTKLILYYAFRILNLNKITCGAFCDNISSIKSNQKCGFEIEGKLKNHNYLDGKYRDILRFGILRDKYFKLSKQNEYI